jgi:hypothetical protein
MMAPNLCNAMRITTRSSHSVADVPRNGCWIKDITGALDMAALEQYVKLWCRLQEVALSDVLDRFI